MQAQKTFQPLQNQQQPLTHEKQQQRHQNIQYQSLAIFCIVIALVVIVKIFSSYDQDVQNGRFYTDHLMTLELIDFWKLNETQMQQEQSQKGWKIINQTQHQITRQELGHQSWTLLHMITGGFPQTFDDNLRKKFNTFLVLFGQMYPCKLCANHFMMLLKQEGLFTGNTKKQLMQYLCRLHNIVNEKLGHPIHDCSKVTQQWNTCGCSGTPIG